MSLFACFAAKKVFRIIERQFKEKTETLGLCECGPLNGEDILGHYQVNIFCRCILRKAATAIRNRRCSNHQIL